MIELYLLQLEGEKQTIYRELIEYLSGLGYNPKKEGLRISFKHDMHRKHDEIISRLMEEFQEKYGDDFTDAPFYGNYDDILITIYTK